MVLEFQNCTIHLVDSCKNLTAHKHKEFYNQLAQEKDIGSNTTDLKSRLSDALTYFESDPKAAKTAIMNAYFTISSMIEKIDYAGRAFALLVLKYTIDGNEIVPDYSDESLDRTIEDISSAGITHQMIEDKVSEVKKKSKENWPFSSLKTTE